MRLLLDAGNTRVKLSWMSLNAQARAPVVAAFGYDEMAALGAWVAALPERPLEVWAAGVVDSARMVQLEQLLSAASGAQTAVGLPVHWQQSQTYAAGVRSEYLPSHALGPDRWAGLLGVAWNERRLAGNPLAPVLLASFGTATTVDALLPSEARAADEYVFPGGLILPGVQLMARSLAQGTARLPEEAGVTRNFPAQTRDAIATGVAAAQLGAVWRQWRRIEQSSSRAPARLYVTGGAWPALEAEALQWFEPTQIVWLASPALDGLACLARHKQEAGH